MTDAYLQFGDDAASGAGTHAVQVGGDWTIRAVTALDQESERLVAAFRKQRATDTPITFNFSELGRLDSAGAWIIYRTTQRLQEQGFDIEPEALSEVHAPMLQQMARDEAPVAMAPPSENWLLAVLARLGKNSREITVESREITGFLGHIVVALLRTVLFPKRLRYTALIAHIEKVGFNALPIVGTISLLIGVVLAYQGAIQLQRFGAEIFVINLIGVSILRELGILLTAIVVAGRSGSAFAAEIGSMKLHEEIDAMRILGLDPMDVLIVPRVLALVIALPLLAFFADMMGLLGGGLMAWVALGISPAIFIDRLGESVSLWSFYVGIIKAPVFGFLIALVGCFEGLKVTGSAESVGLRTTRAVVTAIFLVIAADAVFSIFFAQIGI